MSKSSGDTKKRWFLKTNNPDHTMNGYEFSDETHAREWMAQLIVQGAGYELVNDLKHLSHTEKQELCTCKPCPVHRPK
jgi:hypothetical protein